MCTVATLQRYLEGAPLDPGPLAPNLLGWNTCALNFVCAHCAGRIMARGCRFVDVLPCWKDGDRKPAGPCCCCKPPAADPPPVDVTAEQAAKIIGAAVALFQKTDRVNNGIWQVPHAAMRKLVAELTAAGVQV